MNLLRTLLIVQLVGLATSAYGIDFGKYFSQVQSPACGGISLIDETVTACEFDKNLIVQGKCGDVVAVHKIPQFSICRSIAHPFDPSSQFEKLPVTDEGKIIFAVLAAVHGKHALPMPDLSPLGPFMPKGTCEEAGKALTSRPRIPGFYVAMDHDFPTWRDCMNQLAESIVAGLESNPRIVALRKVESILTKIDLSRPSDVTHAKKFIIAIDNEPTQPSLERIITLLEQDSN